MPNAQTHLASVWTLLAQPPIRAAFPWLGEQRVRSAFLLGAISPDVRAVTGQPREETHFFDSPMGETVGHTLLLRRWPGLSDATRLDREHAAFVAGYLTHLIMDETWVEMIVMRGLFVEGLTWDTEHPNWGLYGLLMTYLEYRAAERLPAEVVDLLAAAEPHGWLPFVEDRHLVDWRQHVVDIIRRGGPRLISRMFAHTNGMSTDELEALVLSEERMAEEVFCVIPREQLLAFEAASNERSQGAVAAYLRGLAAPA